MSETMKINAYAIHLRNIRAIFNYAIDEEIITVYPFRKFKIKKEETSKRSLTREQLITLRDYPCEEYQRRYRDIFMLMFYLIGINAADLFTAKRIINNRLEYHRAKTNKLYSIKIEPEAMEIINRYHGNDYLLNVLDEYKDYKDFLHRMGIALKQIGECKRVGRGGKKVITPLFPDISSYWSRHTWASIAAELDIPKETIAAALGHSQNSVTDIYINFDKKKIDEANRLVIDSLK
jgi:integrase